MKDIFLLDNAIVYDGEEAADTAADTVAATSANSSASTSTSGSAGGFGAIGMIIYIVALVAVFYFFVIRPQRKREKDLKNLQDSISVGDSVVTSSGFYGKVTDIYSDSYVIEFGLNKGVRVPVSKSEVIGKKEPNLSVKTEA